MLTKDEERSVELILLEFARRGQSKAAETASILARLPANPEAGERLVELARKRGMPWVEYLAGTIASMQKDESGALQRPKPPVLDTNRLAELLRSDEKYQRKVDALLAAAKSPTPELAAVIRERLPVEQDPFVLATLISCLSSAGSGAEDAPRLRQFIGHADTRVVANTLDALKKLAVRLSPGELEEALRSHEHRVAMNALALLARVDAKGTLERVKAQVHSPDPSRRAGLGYLLGEMSGEEDATVLLMSMLEAEQQTLVLKQLARSLQRHAGTPRVSTLVEGLLKLHAKASGAKRSILDSLLHDLRSGSLVEEDTEMTFADVWGAPPPVKAREPVQEVVEEPSPPPPARGGRWIAGAALGLAAVTGVWMMQEPPERDPAASPEPASNAIRRQAAAAPRTALAGVARREPVGAGGWSGGGGAAPTVELPVAGQNGVKVPKHFGKIGAKVDVKGKLIGKNAGAPIVEAAGRHFMIVKGTLPEDVREGDAYHLLGKLVGRSVEGLLYVEANPR